MTTELEVQTTDKTKDDMSCWDYLDFSEDDTEEERKRKIMVNGHILKSKKKPYIKFTRRERKYWRLFVEHLTSIEENKKEDGVRGSTNIFTRNVQVATFFLRVLKYIQKYDGKPLHWRVCRVFLISTKQQQLKRNSVLRRMTIFEKEGWIKKISQKSMHNPYKGGRLPPLYLLNLSDDECAGIINAIKEKYGEDFVEEELE